MTNTIRMNSGSAFPLSSKSYSGLGCGGVSTVRSSWAKLYFNSEYDLLSPVVLRGMFDSGRLFADIFCWLGRCWDCVEKGIPLLQRFEREIFFHTSRSIISNFPWISPTVSACRPFWIPKYCGSSPSQIVGLNFYDTPHPSWYFWRTQ